MKSSPKLFLSLFPGFIVGMFFQHQITNSQPENITTTKKMQGISKGYVDQYATKYKSMGSINNNQMVYGASFSRDEVIQIVNGSSQDIYVRIGFDQNNNKQVLFIGNDNGSYITPAEGYCPSHCPFDN